MVRTALYLWVSTDGQHAANPLPALELECHDGLSVKNVVPLRGENPLLIQTNRQHFEHNVALPSPELRAQYPVTPGRPWSVASAAPFTLTDENASCDEIAQGGEGCTPIHPERVSVVRILDAPFLLDPQDEHPLRCQRLF